VAGVPTVTERLLGRTAACKTVGTSKSSPATFPVLTVTVRLDGLDIRVGLAGTTAYVPGSTKKL
jgi:hypothetical protein